LVGVNVLVNDTLSGGADPCRATVPLRGAGAARDRRRSMAPTIDYTPEPERDGTDIVGTE